MSVNIASTAIPLSNSAPMPDGATHYNIDQKCFLALFDKKNVMYFNPDDGGWWRKLTNGTSNKMFLDAVEIDLVSPASLLTDEQAEARMGEPIVIERASIQQANIDGGLAVNDVVLRKASKPHDPVNNPSHYASGGIECIDAMQAMLSREEFIGYLRGNIFKYQWRYKLKNGVEDLKKAQWYQNKLIEVESND